MLCSSQQLLEQFVFPCGSGRLSSLLRRCLGVAVTTYTKKKDGRCCDSLRRSRHAGFVRWRYAHKEHLQDPGKRHDICPVLGQGLGPAFLTCMEKVDIKYEVLRTDTPCEYKPKPAPQSPNHKIAIAQTSTPARHSLQPSRMREGSLSCLCLCALVWWDKRVAVFFLICAPFLTFHYSPVSAD